MISVIRQYDFTFCSMTVKFSRPIYIGVSIGIKYTVRRDAHLPPATLIHKPIFPKPGQGFHLHDITHKLCLISRLVAPNDKGKKTFPSPAITTCIYSKSHKCKIREYTTQQVGIFHNKHNQNPTGKTPTQT